MPERCLPLPRYRGVHGRHRIPGRDRAGRAGPYEGGLADRVGGGGDQPDREAQPAAERGHPPAVRPGAWRGGGQSARRAVPGRAVPPQGPRGGAGRHTLQRGARLLRRLRVHGDPGAHPALHRRRLRHLRKDEHARARHSADGRAAAFRPVAEPVEHQLLDRWIVGRLCSRSRIGHGAGRARQRRRRLHPHSGVVLWPGGVEAHPGAQLVGPALRRHHGRSRLRPRGDALGARLRGRARRHGRTRAGRPLLGAAEAWAVLRRRGRQRAAAGCASR